MLFANTGGIVGPGASRDLYVMNVLAQLGGVRLGRMVRLEGGLYAWRDAGLDVAPPPKPQVDASSLAAVLQGAGLAHLAGSLAEHSFESLAAALAIGRTHLLGELKAAGLALPDRQKVASTLARTVKAVAEGRGGEES